MQEMRVLLLYYRDPCCCYVLVNGAAEVERGGVRSTVDPREVGQEHVVLQQERFCFAGESPREGLGNTQHFVVPSKGGSPMGGSSKSRVRLGES
jgi:hypothetical protein